jgi:hypothetical protein
LSSLVIAGDTSGTITLQAPAVSGTTTLTLPASSGTVMVNGPAFSAYPSVATSIANNSSTKLTFDTKLFDTNNNFASSRFTPTVAGYYQISGGFTLVAGSGIAHIELAKNGSIYSIGSQCANNSSGVASTISCLVYMNGSTDYVEMNGFQNSGGAVYNFGAGSAIYNWFTGVLVRGA